jgi:hypothetical protein
MRYWIFLFTFTLFGCFPNTYYSTTDDYVVGLRWHDRGNYENAIKYWDPLVVKGDCDAEYRVGTLYFLGRGKPQNNEKAIELWRKAANANQQRAQWALGDLYYHQTKITHHGCAECPVKQDLITALFWYKLFEKSAKYEDEKKYLSYILPKIIAEMNPEQIQEASTRASIWAPAPKDCGARNLW